MPGSRTASDSKDRSVVLGVRSTVELRTRIKVEAARRGITVAELFEEMWRGYIERQKTRKS